MWAFHQNHRRTNYQRLESKKSDTAASIKKKLDEMRFRTSDILIQRPPYTALSAAPGPQNHLYPF